MHCMQPEMQHMWAVVAHPAPHPSGFWLPYGLGSLALATQASNVDKAIAHHHIEHNNAEHMQCLQAWRFHSCRAFESLRWNPSLLRAEKEMQKVESQEKHGPEKEEVEERTCL